MMKSWLLSVSVALACGLPAATALAQTGSKDKLTFITGGVGIDGREDLARRESEFNFKLVTAMKPSGQYLAGANVTVTDGKGAPLLQATMKGPWLLAELPPGKYTVQVTFDGKPVAKTVSIPSSGLREAYFYWDVADEIAAGESPTAQASAAKQKQP